MLNKVLRKEDFNFSYSSRGYTLIYKGKFVGGATIARSAKGPIGMKAVKQCTDYRRSAEREIENMLTGRIPPSYKNNILKILEEESKLKYLCGKCGCFDSEDKFGFCAECGADYWIEARDLEEEELQEHIKKAARNLGITIEELTNKFK